MTFPKKYLYSYYHQKKNGFAENKYILHIQHNGRNRVDTHSTWQASYMFNVFKQDVFFQSWLTDFD